MLRTVIKNFSELSCQELYDLLQLRSEVFVVEQHCVYLDMDGKDEKAIHVLGFEDDKLVAYLRIFKPGDYYEETTIGRVVVKKKMRSKGYGYDIMKASIKAVETKINSQKITVSAQTYLRKFYNELGFIEQGEEYMEDDIPHIRMTRLSDH
ncbi:MAG: GNAT family N-acetyltransferase [Flavobacteriaceae bacterium]|nr:GNAT family N-acetyltransferase [Bacteroidia bacterium]MBT8286612.1 GNAT family N-acetyltransferase [Bacteroidia bacterium]NNF75137.1 GNAT family N-acetyltransferase [Flavobacteriaceae bacterium]NNK72153.1 GNAT family N-acetyltransferase [Flavobacteriaceae bacterium]